MKEDTSLPPRAASRKDAKPKNAKPPKKKASWGKRLLILFFCVLLLVAGFVVYLFIEGNKALDTIGRTDIPEVPAEESVKVKPVSILLLGLDYRPQTKTMLTDVMMVATLNPDSKTATVVSIPRDSLIKMDGVTQRKANAHYNSYLREATKSGLSQEQAELQAMKKMREMLGKFFDIPIQYTAIINFNGFIDVVDALGGITVDVEMDMRYQDKADGTNINLTKGIRNLTGQEALDYVRYRKSNDGKNMSSDFDRNRRQNIVIGEIVDKMKSFGGIIKLGSVISAAGDNVSTDIHRKELEELVLKYVTMGKGNITFMPLEGSWKEPYVYLNEEKLNAARAALQEKLKQ